MRVYGKREICYRHGLVRIGLGDVFKLDHGHQYMGDKHRMNWKTDSFSQVPCKYEDSLPLLLARWPSTGAHPKNIGNVLIPIVTKAGPPCSESQLFSRSMAFLPS